jgi:iron(III) transport system ATP-binding protein
VLRIVNVTKRYPAQRRHAKQRDAVHDVSLTVRPGEFFTLLGPSGCGKTTLLRSVAGLEQPNAGEIWIGGRLVYAAARKISTPADDRPIGMVFQSYAVWPHMTVTDNVEFAMVSGRRRLPRKDAAVQAQALLGRLGLGDHAKSSATRLSGGQQQRLALARALACQPDVLLLDEPLSNLDAALRASLRRELKRQQSEFGITALYVTHDQAEALALSDRIAVMRLGQVIQVGTPRELYADPATPYVARLTGGANVFSGEVTGADGADGTVEVRAPFGLVRCRTRAPRRAGEQVTCFVRADGLTVLPAADASGSGAHGDGSSVTGGSGASVFAGTLRSVDFVGYEVSCVVEAGGTTLTTHTDVSTEVRAGDRVRVAITPLAAAVFPQDDLGGGASLDSAGEADRTRA